MFSRYTFPLYLYCLAAIALSLTSSLSYSLNDLALQLPCTTMSVNELRKQVILFKLSTEVLAFVSLA